MPRVIQAAVPAEKTKQLLEEMQKVPGLIGLRLQKGISIQPPGDVIVIETLNRALPTFIRLLESHGIGAKEEGAITTTEPLCIMSQAHMTAISGDSSESIWEEMDLLIAKESNMTVNALLLMAVSGVFAAIGLATSSLHIVLAAMAIAPGFEPLARVALGLAANRRVAWRGASDTAKGYAALVLGAAVATLLLQLLGKAPLAGAASYLPAQVLLSYWTTVSPSSFLVVAAAATAGAVLIATNRSVLTAGVMIALSLVPSAAIVGMALVSGDVAILAMGLSRFAMEAVGVVAFSLAVFAWKRSRLQKRNMA